ncbi:uncharacterized protein CBL_08045 [Carabus blaptoides fortunei]
MISSSVRVLTKMSVGLAVLGFVNAITIDNHLLATRNDCYERLAIGQRLDSRDVFKTIPASTVAECQTLCSQEDHKCLSLSFGIAPEGNGTCELSFITIKETADLRPIGTVRAADYDLFIKKTDCKLNIPKDPPSSLSIPLPPHKPVHERPQDTGPAYYKPNEHRPLTDLHRPVDSHRPTYLVAILDAHPAGRPPGSDRPKDESYGPAYGGRPSYRPNYDKPYGYNPDRKDHFDRPYGQTFDGPYQNYYDVPRPLPQSSYGAKPESWLRPVSLYNNDQYYYGMPRPQPGDSYDQNRPNYLDFDRPHRYGERPNLDYGLEPDHSKPYGLRPHYPANTQVYDDRPPRPYDPEPDRHRPYRPHSPDNPNVYDDRRPVEDRPYGQKPDISRPNPDNPNIYEHGRPGPNKNRPYGPEPDRFIPYGPELDQHRPYGPDRNTQYGGEPDRNRPYGLESDVNRPYSPDPDKHRPYGPELDRNRPYGSEPDRNGPYGLDPHNPNNPDSYDRRPIFDRPYGPEPGRDRPHRPSVSNPGSTNNYDDRHPGRPYGSEPIFPDNFLDKRPPIGRPYGPEPEHNTPYGPDPHNPNNYGDIQPFAYGPVKGPIKSGRPDYNNDKRPDRPYGPEPYRPNLDDRRPDPDNPNSYDSGRPLSERPYSPAFRPNHEKDDQKPQSAGGYDSFNHISKPEEISGKPGYGDKTSIQSTPDGGTVTSIITQILEPCFRRVLAGKRIARSFIKRAVPCERVEDCQRECQEEKRFVCEGFNYRLDPAGRGQGDCELTNVPLARVDIGRDIIPDREYDFYEKDRNSGPDCRPLPYGGLRPSYPPTGGLHCCRHSSDSGHGYPPSSSGGGGWHRPGSAYPPSGYPHSGPGLRPGHDRYPLPPARPPTGGRYPPEYGRPPPGYRPAYDEGRKDIGPPGPPHHYYEHHYSNRDRQDHHHYSFSSGYHYPVRPHPPYADSWRPSYHHVQPLPPPPNRRQEPHYPHYDPHYRYQDSYYHDREKDRNYWGFNNYGQSRKWGSYGGTYGNFGGPDSYYGSFHYGHDNRRNQNRHDYEERRHFIPYRIGQVGGPIDWGRYGGSYGTGGYHSGDRRDSYNYWGFDKHHHHGQFESDRRHYHELPRPSGGGHSGPGYDRGPYLPLDGHHGGVYSHHSGGSSHFDSSHGHGGHQINHIGYDDSSYHRPASTYPRDDDCSTRQGMGFRLHKTIVKKFYAVPNIHECEKLCYIEKDFTCVSFSFRYSITLSSPSDNCYLSDRSYKDLDFYTDLEPDRDFDIYTMHKRQSCLIPVVREESECFLRVRSGQRLDHTVVKDSIDCKSIVDCQLECLTSKRFTCRSFSYRYGPPFPGGSIDNCQLSDWPYAELDPRKDLVPEPGYEVYERGSYGHGCEQDHFTIPGHQGIGDHGGAVPKPSDKICYVGYAKPARLSSEATKGALSVATELACKAECTRAREETEFPCMSFSYRNLAPKGQPNCELSDIELRDLLPDLDYTRDPDSWLFAWDNYSPQCSALDESGGHGQAGRLPHGPHNALDTWRVYSVSGWPCRRGTTCQENREAGFWSCELEGGEVGSWDYCCRPDHRCGYSHGYHYPWCYVGPSRDQWRKCSDRYYPYQHHQFPADKHNSIIHTKPHYAISNYEPYLPKPASRPSSTWLSERPYRPPYGSSRPEPRPPRPSLDEYEDKFHQQFLDPPKPGGFGPARHWPVSYLHKELPPNTTMDELPDRQNRNMIHESKKYEAITNLVQTIKSNDFSNSKEDKKLDDFDDLFLISVPKNRSNTENQTGRTPKRDLHSYPVVEKDLLCIILNSYHNV